MSKRSSIGTERRLPERIGLVSVPVAFLAIAGALWAEPFRVTKPAMPPTSLVSGATDSTPVRQPRLKPELDLAGSTYRCSACHGLFESPPETTRTLTQHQDIELQHGRNTRCLNCHSRTNRDAFVDDWGHDIPFDQPQLVCAKCHGPVYRDWLHGSHGRVNGYWRAALAPSGIAAPQVRRRCIECHDPHRPPFPPLHPAPPPQTLRMGDQRPATDDTALHDPLRVFRRAGPRSGCAPLNVGLGGRLLSGAVAAAESGRFARGNVMDPHGRNPHLPRRRWLEAALVPGALLAVAGFLWSNPLAFTNPVPPPPIFPDYAAQRTTVHQPAFRPELHLAGRVYQCDACHSKFHAEVGPKPALYIHRGIVLKHGLNNRCYNCHNEANLGTLVDDHGREIPYDQPQLLCAKCHGEVYRDWLNGAHGRVNGAWDPRYGPRERHVCDECHDPHQPPFPPLAPAPPPMTPRMGFQPERDWRAGRNDPLRVYAQEPTTSAPAPPAPDEYDMEDPEEGF